MCWAKLTLWLSVLALVVAAGGVLADQEDVEDPVFGICLVGANPTGPAECDVAAISATGNSDAEIVAATATGNADASYPLSATGQCRDGDTDDYRACVAVNPDGHADGYYLVIAGDGDAEGAPIAIAPRGKAKTCDGATIPYAPDIAVSVEDDARSCGIAATVWGDAQHHPELAGASMFGDAGADWLAVSGTGDSEAYGESHRICPVLLSCPGSPTTTSIAISGTGNASAGVERTRISDPCRKDALSLSVCAAIAVSGTGNADAKVDHDCAQNGEICVEAAIRVCETADACTALPREAPQEGKTHVEVERQAP